MKSTCWTTVTWTSLPLTQRFAPRQPAPRLRASFACEPPSRGRHRTRVARRNRMAPRSATMKWPRQRANWVWTRVRISPSTSLSWSESVPIEQRAGPRIERHGRGPSIRGAPCTPNEPHCSTVSPPTTCLRTWKPPCRRTSPALPSPRGKRPETPSVRWRPFSPNCGEAQQIWLSPTTPPSRARRAFCRRKPQHPRPSVGLSTSVFASTPWGPSSMASPSMASRGPSVGLSWCSATTCAAPFDLPR